MRVRTPAVLAFLGTLGLGVAACNGSTSPGGTNCACSGSTGQCVCDSFSMPVCQPGATTGSSCASSANCMGCWQGAGYECVCSAAGILGGDAGGSHWMCIGTEYACTGTTR